MDKEFGKVSREQLRAFVGYLRALPQLWVDWRNLVAAHPDRLRDILTPAFHWAQVYTLSAREHLAIVAALGGFDVGLRRASMEPDPEQSLLDSFEDDTSTSPSPAIAALSAADQRKYFLGAWLAWLHTLQSVWHYGATLNDLIARVRDGDDEALFKAVRIDPSITSCPPVADRVAWAEVTQDVAFFQKLRNAFAGPPKKPSDAYGPLRYVLMLLAEDGTLGRLSMEACYDLLCVDLALYPADAGDPARSLHKFIRRWQQSQST